MAEQLTCSSCQHWKPVDRGASYAAECGAGSYPGRVAFDMTCDKHSGKAQPPAVDMQSQARGIYQMWGVPRP